MRASEKRSVFRNATLMVILIVSVMLIFVWACASDKSTAFEEDEDDDDFDDDSEDDDDEDTTPPDPPDVDSVTSPTPLDVQSVMGTAEPDSVITVLGGAEPGTTKADKLNGSWCVTVTLVESSSNDLSITATDAALNESEPATVSIVQDPASGPDEENVALNGVALAASSSTTECPECTADKAVDGNQTTYWRNSTNTLTNPDAERYPQWFMVNLVDSQIINSSVIIWYGDQWATSYQIAYSELTSPPYPHDNHEEPNWYTVYVNTMGSGGTEYIDFDVPFAAKWVAIIMYEGNNINELTGKPRYAIAEWELNGYPEDEWPTDPGCD